MPTYFTRKQTAGMDSAETVGAALVVWPSAASEQMILVLVPCNEGMLGR